MYETQATKKLRVVDETSSDPGIHGVFPVPVDADHISIAKPPSRDDHVYGAIRKFVSGRLSADFGSATNIPRQILVHIDVVPPEKSAKLAIQKTVGYILDVARSAFPGSDAEYPNGSFVERTGTAVVFAMKKPTVAVRAAIEFAQAWHRFVLENHPDCRITIDYFRSEGPPISSGLSSQEALGLLPAGRIYLSEAVVDACDPTLASFSPHCSVWGTPRINVYRAEFADPRTVADSSLVHALFIAQPDADEAGDRLLELFMAEYLLEKQSLSSFFDLLSWMATKGYPCPPAPYLQELASKSQYFHSTGSPPVFSLTEQATQLVATAKNDYRLAKERCVSLIEAELRSAIRSPKVLDNVDLPKLVDKYLTAMFLEIRLMANYVRRTSQFFDGSSELLQPLDYLILSHLRYMGDVAVDTWRSAFLRGLKAASSETNLYIAAVFHNVLATYYLNRNPSQKHFQVGGLGRREVYIDTNVLYAVVVEASSYHSLIKTCLDNLTKLGFRIKIFPFSVEEYERSLAHRRERLLEWLSSPLARGRKSLAVSRIPTSPFTVYQHPRL